MRVPPAPELSEAGAAKVSVTSFWAGALCRLDAGQEGAIRY